jgi:hypothetical protein
MPLSSERQPRRAVVSAQTETATAGAQAHRLTMDSQAPSRCELGRAANGSRARADIVAASGSNWVRICLGNWIGGLNGWRYALPTGAEDGATAVVAAADGRGGGGTWSKPGGYVKIVGAIMQIITSRLTIAIQIRSICKVIGLFANNRIAINGRDPNKGAICKS